MIKIKLITWGFICSLLLSCSASEDDSNLSPLDNVSGTYSFTTSNIDAYCTDGSIGTYPALALNFNITQSGTSLTFANTNTAGVPGITFLSSTELNGNLSSNNSFVANQFATAIFDGIAGEVTLSYNVSGTFSSTGWSGNYEYSAFFQSLSETCYYSTTFSGSKSSANTLDSISMVKEKSLSDNYLDKLFIGILPQ